MNHFAGGLTTKHGWLALIAFTGILASCDNPTSDKEYETIVVRRRTLSSTVLATGVIKPKVGAEVRVGSRVSGVVKQLNVRVGDSVRRGDLLAQLDDVELTAQYHQATAALDNASTTLKFAGIEKERQEKLFEAQAVSRQSLDLAVRTYELARSQVAQAHASVEFAKVQLGYTRITAPIGGAVASVATQEGETVAAMFTAPTFVTIIDLERLEVRAYVDETDISKVAVGQKAEFTVDTYQGIAFEGVVRAIYPKAELIDNVVNYVVIIDIKGSRERVLRPEMTTTVNVFGESLEDVIVVPNKAIVRKNGDEVVYVLKDGVPEERRVTVGVKNKNLTQITSGLSENDQLILNN